VTTSLAFGLTFLFGDFHTQAIIAILMLMIFDTILGVMATYSEGQSITSRKFARVVQKGFVYFMSISAGYFADLTIGWQVIQATMIGFIGVTEFISILENMGRLGYQTPKRLLNQLENFKSSK
jgi:phage-related holin